MVVGIGVDCVEVERVAKSIARDTFRQRVFSEGERALFEGRSEARVAELAAGCFAAKEAFLKAVGTGLGGFELTDIAALRQLKKSENATGVLEMASPTGVASAVTGKPYFAFTGEAAAYIEREGLAAHLSLTHDGGMVIAFVVLEKE